MAGTGVWLSDQDLLQSGGAIWAQQQVRQVGQQVRAGQDWASEQIARAQEQARQHMAQLTAATPPPPTPTPAPVTAPPPPPTAAPEPAALPAAPTPAPSTPLPQVPQVPLPQTSTAQAGDDWANQQIQNLLNPSGPTQTAPGGPPAIPGAGPTPAPTAAPGAPSGLAGPQPGAPGDFIDQARQAARAVGIDPEIFTRQIQQESGFNPQAGSSAGAQGIAQFMPQTAQGLGIDPWDPGQALPAAARLMKSHLDQYGGDWSKALAAYNAGPGNVEKYGGVPPFEETQRYIKNILGGAQDVVQQGMTAVNTAVDAVHSAVARASQFGLGLSSGDAMAFCGPTAALAFAQAYGRNPSVDEAKQLAQQVGWNPDQGMAGPSSEVALLNKLGIDAHMTSGVDWGTVARQSSSGNPVIVDTPGHYFYVDGFNPQTGQYHVGTSGTDLKGGSEWMTSDQINAMPQSGGAARAAIYADHPLTAPSLAGVGDAVGGAVGGALGGLGGAFGGLGDLFGGAGRGLQDKAQQTLQAVQDVGSQATQHGLDLLSLGRDLPSSGLDIQNLGLGQLNAANDLLQPLREGLQGAGSTLSDLNANPPLLGLRESIANAPVLGGALGMLRGPALLSDQELLAEASPQGLDAARQLARLGTGGPEPTDAQIAESLRSMRLGEAYAGTEPGMQRMYHGTGADFPSVDPARIMGEDNLYGPGYYLTSDPRVAGGLVQSETVPFTPTQQSLIDRGLLSPENARSQAGAVLRPGYAQARQSTMQFADVDQVRRVLESNLGLDPQLSRVVTDGLRGMTPEDASGKLVQLLDALRVPKADMDALVNQALPNRAGPNVRALDVPQGLNLLDVDAPLKSVDTDTIQQALSEQGQRAMDRFMTAAEGWATPPTVDDLYGYLTSRAEGGLFKGEVNRALADAGYDGITYAGGGRVPMPDAAGNPIEHTANVVFPESLDKIRNAISGRMGGDANVGFAAGLGGLAGLGALGFAGTQNDQVRSAFGDVLGEMVRSSQSLPTPTTGPSGEPNVGVSELLRGPGLTSNQELLDSASPEGLAAARQLAQLATRGREPTDAEVAESLRSMRMGEAYAGTHTPGDITPYEWARGLYRGGVISSLQTMADVAASALSPPFSVASGAVRDIASFQPGRLQGRMFGAQSGLVQWADNFLGSLKDVRPDSLVARAQPGGQRVAAYAAEGAGMLHGAFQKATSELVRLQEIGSSAGEAASARGLSGQDWMNAFRDYLANPPADVLQRAQAMGDRAGLRADSGTLTGVMGKWVQELQKSPAGPIGDALFPVYKMGMSIGSRMVEWSPLGLGGTVADVARGAVGKGPYAGGATPAGSAVGPVGERLTNNLIGTAISAWLAWKALDGDVTGEGPEDPQQQAVWRADGKQPNSFKGPDGQYHSWEKLPPQLRGPFMMAGAYADAAHAYDAAQQHRDTAGPQAYGVEDPRMAAATRLVTEVGHQLASMTPLRTFANLYDTLSSSTSAGQGLLSGATGMASDVLGGAVPLSGALRSVAQMTDPYARKVLYPQLPEEVPPAIVQNLAQNLPGAREALPARVDVLGRPVGNPLQGLGAVVPAWARAAAGQPNPILGGMEAAGVSPPGAPTSIPYGPSGTIRLRPEERQAYETMRGQLLQQIAGPMTASPDFARMPPEAQRIALQQVVQAANQAATRMLLGQIGTSGLQRMEFSGVLAPVVPYTPAVDPLAAQRQAHHQALMQSLLG